MNKHFYFLLPLLIILIIIFIHPVVGLDQDLGRHIKLGEIIWKNKSIPKTNLFSYTHPNFPFINHHWLPEVLFYLFQINFGFNSLIIFKTIILSLTFFILSYFTYKKAPHSLTIIFSLLSLMLFSRRSWIRPEMFSYFFTSIYLIALFLKKDTKIKWILPLIQLVWVNSHIYFFIGPCLAFFYLIKNILDNKNKINKNKSSFFIFFLVCLSNLINPNFLKGAFYPFFVLKNYGYQIVENQTIFFMSRYTRSLYLPVFWLMLLLWIFSAALNRKKQNFFSVSSLLFFTAMVFKAIRSSAFFALAFLPFTSINTYQFVRNIKPEMKKNLLYVPLVLLLPLLFLLVIQKPETTSFGIKSKGKEGVDYVLKEKLQGPIFNNFDIGGYLIYRLYPDYKVFVDNRPEAYPKDFFRQEYIPAQNNPEKWEELEKKYGFKLVIFSKTDITPWGRKFTQWFPQKKDWKEVYSDDYLLIHKKI